MVAVAQLVRAPVCGTGGRGFNSHQPPQVLIRMKHAIPPWLTTTPIAHRGLHNQKLPENSLGAFKHAIKHGYPIELDVHILADNEIIVFHDDNFKRLTQRDARVHEATAQTVKHLKLAGSNQAIPTLQQVLTLVNGQVPLLIEIKSRYTHKRIEPALASALKTYKGAFAVGSFNPMTVRWFRKHQPNIAIGYISGPLSDSDAPWLGRAILSNLLLLPLLRPDFIAYDRRGIDRLSIRFWRTVLRTPFIVWTVRSKREQGSLPKKQYNFVFEKYMPKVIAK